MSILRNTLGDLNNGLFEIFENLAGAETEEELDAEERRSKAATGVAGKIIDNAQLMFDVHQYYDSVGEIKTAPKILIGNMGEE